MPHPYGCYAMSMLAVAVGCLRSETVGASEFDARRLEPRICYIRIQISVAMTPKS